MKYRKSRYGLYFLAALLLVLFVTVSPAVRASTPIAQTPPPTGDFVRDHLTNRLCPATLAPILDRLVDRSTFPGGQWGILAETLSADGTAQPIYSYRSDNLLVPASNIKLLTTAAALQIYAPIPDALRSWFTVIERDSDNDYAQALFERIGGSQAVKQALDPLGIDATSYRQVDGSGLSHHNLAQPLTFVTLLKAMRSAQGSDVFYNSMAVAGISGTLEHRFRNTVVQGKVHAKTGTLDGVHALSGYLDHPDFGTIVFSILGNQSDEHEEVTLQTIDQIVLQLARLSPC